MSFPRIYTEETCTLDGYSGYTFRVLVNPTGRDRDDWAFGGLGGGDCTACAALNAERETDAAPLYCEACTKARMRLGRAAHAIFGESSVDGLDFSSEAAALATFGSDDVPDELLGWLYRVPLYLWLKRGEDMKKKLPLSLPAINGSL